MAQVKICGITSVADAEFCADSGADALGLNFWPGSPRLVQRSAALEITSMLRNRVTIVGVFVDARAEEIAECKHEIGFDWVQLHGSESPALFREFLPTVYKAIGVRRGDTMDDVLQRANAYGHGPVLLDTMVPGDMPGGTGVTFDWKIAAEVAKERLVTLAGGLTPENVAAAVAAVHPYRVDVASGVESAPGIKDRDKVRAFIAAAKVGKDD